MFELPQQNLDRAKHQEQLAQIQSLERTMVGAFSQLVQYLDGKVTKTEVINQLQSIGTPDVLKVVAAVQALDAHLSQNKLDLSPISETLNRAVAELQQIPKTLPELPEQRESVAISNLPDLDKHFASLEKAISSLDLHVEAPKVDVKVPQTKITVEKPDLAPLQSLLLQVVHAVQAIKLPEPKPTDVSGVEKRLEGLGEWHDLSVKELKEANKKLQKIVEKPVSSGGGGGGGGPVYKDSTGTLAYPQLTVDGKVPVDATFSGTVNASTEYTDGAAAIAHPVGGIPVFNKAGTITAVSDTNPLPVSASVTATVASANNSYGSTTSLADASTASLVSIPSSAAGYKVTGLLGTGTGDGYFFVQVAGSTIFSGRTSVSQQSIEINLPNPVAITTASAVTLKVTNKSGSTADFEATLLGV